MKNENKIPSLKGFEIGNTINDSKDISVPKLSIEETSKFTKDLEKSYKEKMNTFNLEVSTSYKLKIIVVDNL